MPIEINNTKTTLIAGNYTFITSVDSVVGMIVRVFNTGSTTQTYTYTDPYNAPVTVSVPASGSAGNPLYVLAASSSAADSWKGENSGYQGSDKNVIAIRLLITGSSVGNAFTESLITTPGAGNWTKPTGVTEVIVECWGGGAAGAGATATNSGGGGGSGASYSRKLLTYPSAQQTVPYSVAASVAGGTGAGSNGNDTSWNTNQVVAQGGTGGGAFSGGSGAGGTASTASCVGDVIYEGFSGGAGFFNSPNFAVAGNGGIGAGSSGRYSAPTGSLEYGGNQADGFQITTSGQDGVPGNNYGGGGSGAAKISGANRSGGSGAQGLIRLIYR